MFGSLRAGRCLTLAVLSIVPFFPSKADAQLWTWTKEQMLQYTKAWSGERFPDRQPEGPRSVARTG